MKYASKETKSAVKLYPKRNVVLVESKNDVLRGSKTSGGYFANIFCNKFARRLKRAQKKKYRKTQNKSSNCVPESQFVSKEPIGESVADAPPRPSLA